jgi:hypothetical protein
MSWPTAPINRSNLIDSSKDPDDAREDLLDLVDAVNIIIAARNATDGIPMLDGSYIPGANLDPEDVLWALSFQDGHDTGLDADLLDGKQGSEYVLADGSTTINIPTTVSNGVVVEREVAGTAAVYDLLTLKLNTTGAAQDGFGGALPVYLEDDGGTSNLAAKFVWAWEDANIATGLDAYLAISSMRAGSLQEDLRVANRTLQLYNRATPAVYPAAGSIFAYAKSDGLYYQDATGAEIGPLGAGGGGVTDHGGLTGLADDDHSQYVLADGTRVMAGDLQLGAHSLLVTEIGAKPVVPSTGQWKLYFKAGGLYYVSDAGVEVGPVLTGGVVHHGDLAGLADDDHTQYALRQPATTDTVFNDAGADWNLRVETTGLEYAFNIDAGTNAVFVNASGTALGVFHASSVGTARPAIYALGQGGTAYGAIVAAMDGATATTPGNLGATIMASGGAVQAGYFLRAQSSPTEPVVQIEDQDATATQAALLLKVASPDAGLLYAYIGSDEIVSVGNTAFVVNATQSAYDFAVYGTGATPLFFVDGDAASVCINAFSGSGEFNVVGDGKDAIVGSASTAGKSGVKGTGTIGVGTTGSSASGTGIYGSSTTGRAGYFYRDSTSAPAEAIVEIFADNVTDDKPLLRLTSDGVGRYLEILDGSTHVFSIPDDRTILWRELAGNPAGDPDADHWRLFFKSDGLYTEDDAGVVVGPLGYISGLGDAAAASTIDCEAYTQTWRWNFSGNDNQLGFVVTEEAAGTGDSNYLLKVATPAASTTVPLYVVAGDQAYRAIQSDGMVRVDVTPSEHTSAFAFISNLTATLTGAAAGETFRLFSGTLTVTGSGDSYNSDGGYFHIWPTGSGDLNRLRALYAQVTHDGSGTITDAYGLYVGITNNATMTNAYRVYIADDLGASATNNYGIYQPSTDQCNVFAGRTIFGSSVKPSKGFEVLSGTGSVVVHDATSYPTRPGFLSVEPASYTAIGATLEPAAYASVEADPASASVAGFTGVQGRAASAVACAMDLTAGNYPNLSGLYGYALHYGSGTAAKVVGVYGRAYAGATGGVVAVLAGVEAAVSVAGEATDAVGLLLPAFTVTGTATNRWGIKQTGTEDSLLAGTLLLTPETVLPTPESMLHIYRNTANEHAWMKIENDSDADTYIHFCITGTYDWVLGVDNSDGDKFKIANGGTYLGDPAGSEVVTIDGDQVRIDNHLGVDINAHPNLALRLGGAAGVLGITDGVTAPAAIAGTATIFVDTADGDLKVTFGDGYTVTLAVDS